MKYDAANYDPEAGQLLSEPMVRGVRRSAASAFTALVIGGGISLLGGSTEPFILGAMVGAVIFGRRVILHGLPDTTRALSTLMAVAPPQLTRAIAGSEMLKAISPAPQPSGLPALRDRIRQAVLVRGLEPVMEEPLHQLEHLLEIHAQLVTEQRGYLDHLAEHPVAEVAAEIRRLSVRVEEAVDPTRALLLQNLEILRMRYEKLDAIRVAHEVAVAQCAVIADTLRLVHDQVLAATSTDDLRGVLSRAAASIRATDETLRETRGMLAPGPRLGNR